jgi:hypothetical protein
MPLINDPTNMHQGATTTPADAAWTASSGANTTITGADAAMNGVYQVTALTSTSQWDVTRRDGATIVTAASASCSLDQNCVDTPDAIIVEDDAPAEVTGLASADYPFTFDYSNNVQGGRSGGDVFVLAKAVGYTGAQYTQSSVAKIESAIALTIPLVSQIERNTQ